MSLDGIQMPIQFDETDLSEMGKEELRKQSERKSSF